MMILLTRRERPKTVNPMSASFMEGLGKNPLQELWDFIEERILFHGKKDPLFYGFWLS